MAATEPATLEDLDGDERAALRTLLFRLADDELVLGERYTEWQVFAPTLESDLALANIAQDEFGHARLYYDLLEDFGDAEADLVFERDPGDFKHATLVELETAAGDWGDAVVRGYLYDVAEQLRLEAIADSRYGKLADRVEKIAGEEEYHREHAQNWLERLASEPESRERLQDAVDRLFPHALALFEPVDEDREAAIEEYGFRTESLDDMRAQWLDVTVPFLEALDLEVPEPSTTEPTGRDGDHTDAWHELHADMTHTYRDLERTEATKLMEDPE